MSAALAAQVALACSNDDDDSTNPTGSTSSIAGAPDTGGTRAAGGSTSLGGEVGQAGLPTAVGGEPSASAGAAGFESGGVPLRASAPELVSASTPG